MALANFAIMVIVIVCCLSSTALAAGIFSQFAVANINRSAFIYPTEQLQYMRSLRVRHIAALLHETRHLREYPRKGMQRNAPYFLCN